MAIPRILAEERCPSCHGGDGEAIVGYCGRCDDTGWIRRTLSMQELMAYLRPHLAHPEAGTNRRAGARRM